MSPRLVLLGLSTFALGCPQPVSEQPGPRPRPRAEARPSDPRVVNDGEDLYAASTKERAAKTERPGAPGGASPGTGRSDTTNGKCVLFAPELQNPKCCTVETGFDVEVVKKACGRDIYLGESFQSSCGYYFHTEAGTETFLRVSFLPGPTPKDSANVHDLKMRRLVKDPTFASQPVPGTPGALWSRNEKAGLNWAFVPGWPSVRQLSWHDDACSQEGVAKVIAALAAAKPPPKDAERLAMVPTARK